MPQLPPLRQVRAVHDERTVTVYQAYGSALADAALARGTFVPPFSRGRMTWIKPSLCWVLYRSGWATKPDQERLLAVTLQRDGFDWAVAHACLSAYDPAVHPSRIAWKAQLAGCPVRVQWDPERSLSLDALPYRAIQIGLAGEAVDRYVDHWIVALEDITHLAHRMHDFMATDQPPAFSALLLGEKPYLLDPAVAARLGATP